MRELPQNLQKFANEAKFADTHSIFEAAKLAYVAVNASDPFYAKTWRVYDPKVLLLPDCPILCEQTHKKDGCHDFPFGIVAWLSLGSDENFRINEAMFAKDFCDYHGLVYVNGSFYDQNGAISDDQVKQDIFECITPFFMAGLDRKVNSLFGSVRNTAYRPQPPIADNKIFLKGGTTLTFNEDGFFEVKDAPGDFTLNRLPVEYIPDAECPMFCSYVNDLLYREDITVLQEYMGYCLLPTTAAQKALFIKGEGGEGKSVLTSIMAAMLGRSCVAGKLPALETDKFALSTVENKLLFLDDDLNTEKLKETGTIKQLITAAAPMSVQKKGQQAHEILPYARIMVMGNGHVSAMHDRSDGFYRRLILLTCKPKNPTRKDDRHLISKILKELPGIFVWSLTGLQRLIARGYEFPITESMKQAIMQKMLEENPALQFLQDGDWITYGNEEATSKDLYDAFIVWCKNNAIDPPAMKTVLGEFKSILGKQGITPSENVKAKNGRARGFKGIGLTQSAEAAIYDLPTIPRKGWYN